MLCVRAQVSRSPLPWKHQHQHLRPCSCLRVKQMASTQVVEHVVLFKVKDDTHPSKVSAMVNGLGSLLSLDQVLHLSAGPILRNRSSSFAFTHMLHSRYNSKHDLEAYSAHPSHLSVVKESVLPIIDDIMAVDWVAEDLQGHPVPPQGSAIRVSFLKLKDNVSHEAKNEVLGVIRGVPDVFTQINQLSCGENFSPARAKGFSIASLGVFPALSHLDAVDSNDSLLNHHKDKVRDHIHSVVVVDYVVPPPPVQSAAPSL